MIRTTTTITKIKITTMNKKTIRTEAFFSGNIRREKSEDGSGRTIAGTSIVFGSRSTPLWADEDEVAYEVIDREAVNADTIKQSDILLTMFHDREKLLGRCRNGKGTMSCSVDDKGVHFSCELPDTAIGNEALSAVDRGDITGCSFIGDVAYDDYEKVVLDGQDEAGRRVIEYHVKSILTLHDFTITPNPAYIATDTEIKRELEGLLTARERADHEEKIRIEREESVKKQVEEMRKATFRPFGYEW